MRSLRRRVEFDKSVAHLWRGVTDSAGHTFQEVFDLVRIQPVGDVDLGVHENG